MATFKKRGNNWRAQVRLKGFKPISKSFPKKGMAQEWARATEDKLRKLDYDPAVALDGLTVASLMERHLETCVTKKGRELERLMTKHNNVVTGLGTIKLADLKDTDIVEWARERNREVKPQTFNQDLIHLNTVLQMAKSALDIPITNAVITEAKPTLKRLKLIRKSGIRWRRPSTAELQQIDLFYTYNIYKRQIPMLDLVPFAIDSAMRLGEITDLRWEDVCEEKRTVIIRNRKHPTGKEDNDCMVPLLGRTLEIIRRQPKTDARIFPYEGDSIGASFRRTCRVLEIEDLHFHDLRHEGVSRLFEAGYDIPQVVIVSGHISWDSLRRYVQLRPESLHRD